MTTSWRNIVRNGIRPTYFGPMLTKVLRRRAPDSSAAARAWAEDRAGEIDDWCSQSNEPLWNETKLKCAEIRGDGEQRLNALPGAADMGGGGAYPLLYFLVRLLRPQVVVETGVAAGWSSRAILEAMNVNEEGNLYSSDFPYFRLKNPERYIGVVVPERLKGRWAVDTRGDQIALPAISREVPKIDLFHYDSDKSARGRESALKEVIPKMAAGSLILMDDIQDCTYFRDMVHSASLEPTVFRFQGKYLGMCTVGTCDLKERSIEL